MQMNKTWNILPLPGEEEVISLSEKLRVSKSLAGLLIQRGIDTYEAAEAFLSPVAKTIARPIPNAGHAEGG
jgi:single-stranded-DNA-specific exonuclease